MKLWLFTLLLMTTTSWAENLTPHQEMTADSDFAHPDLSFDGLSFAIPPMNPEEPTGECTELINDFARYKDLEDRNLSYFLKYMGGVKTVISTWYTKLKDYEGQSIRFANGTFEPMTDLIENIEVVTKILEDNSVVVDDYIYLYTDYFTACNGNDKVLGLLENYSTNLFDTESEVWRYLREVGEILKGHYENYKQLESAEPLSIAKEEFLPLNSLSSYELGSSGVGEMRDLLNSVFEHFYTPEREKLEKEINEAINVQRGNH